MALKFRRGTAAQKSGSLAFGEPYVNTTLGTLQVGLDTGDLTLTSVSPTTQFEIQSISASAFVSASSIYSKNGFTGSVNFNNLTNVPSLVSSSIQVLGGTTIHSGSYFNGISVVSSSSQIDITLTTNYSTFSGSIATSISASVAGATWTNISGKPSGLVSGSSQIVGILSALNTFSASQESKDLTLSTYTASLETKNSTLATYTASLETKNSTLATYTSSLETKNLTLQTLTASMAAQVSRIQESTASLNLYTSSNDTTNTTQNTKLTRLEESTSSLNTFTSSFNTAIQLTGSNVNIAGNLTIAGTQTTINSTALNIADSVIELNYGGSVVKSGILTKDATGGSTNSGSLLWDGTNDYWIAGVSGSESKILRAGPDGVVSGSSQITYASISSIPGGIVSGSSQITYASISSIPAGIVSGSAQVTPLLPTGVVSGSSQVNFTQLSGISNGIISGSSQTIANLPTGTISGSSQVVGSSITTNTITIAGQSTALGSSVTAETIRTAIGTIVTGSAQISLTATTGYGTYLNQAVLTTSTPTFAGLTINGAITATGDITAYYTSDKRHKNNIQLIPNALEKVTKLNGVTWEWNDDVHEVTKSTPKTGLIAQEVQEVLPEVVKTRDDGFLALDYSKMMGLMVEAIKEQQTQIHSLTIEIEKLKESKGL
jgi:hypothetical protein